MVLIAAAAVLSLVIVALAVIVVAQRTKLLANQHRHWDQEREIARLHESVDHWASDYRMIEKANERLADRFIELANRPPTVIDPPDVAGIVRELGESIGTAIYGRQQESAAQLQQQIRETSMVHEQPQPGEWFPDVEFDTTMGPAPTAGGWVNGQSNQQVPPPEGQTPTHQIINGKLVRIDGQAAFQSGQSAPMPQGGVEQ